MLSFSSNPMNIYLIVFFSLAVTAVVVSFGVAATWIVRHHWIRRTRPGGSPARAGSRSGPMVDVLGRPPDRRTTRGEPQLPRHGDQGWECPRAADSALDTAASWVTSRRTESVCG